MDFSDVSYAPEDYIEVGDVLDSFDFSIDDLDSAARAVTDYTTARLKAIAQINPQPLALMVSGGVDSLHMLACAHAAGIDVAAYTVAWPGSDEATQELDAAKAMCDKFGIVHVSVRPTYSELSAIMAQVTQRLQTSEPWEVLAGSVLYAIARLTPPDAAIVTAAGADTLMRGGKPFSSAHYNADTLGRWEMQVKADIRRGFTRERYIPDFYTRLIGTRANQHYKIWQTRQAVDLVGHLHPHVIRGEDWKQDKLVLRHAARQMGLDEKYTDVAKSPMQVSSGGFAAIEQLVRSELSQQYKGRTYTDPKAEDLEVVLSRLYLDRLWARAAAWPAQHEI